MTVEEKLKNLKNNYEAMNSLLEGTSFKLIHFSKGTQILNSSSNPHAFVIFDENLKSVIPGLMVFLTFGPSKISTLTCWKHGIENSDERDKFECIDKTSRDAILEYIKSKSQKTKSYYKSIGILLPKFA